MSDISKKRKVIIQIAYWAMILAIVYLVFKYLIGMVAPFIFAFIFAALMRPLIRVLNRKGHLRYNVAAILCLILFFLIAGGVVALILAQMVNLATDAVSAIPTTYTDTIEPALERGVLQLEELATRVSPALYEVLSDSLPDIVSSISGAFTDLSVKTVGYVSTWLTKLPTFLLSTLICVIATIFMTLDFPRMRDFIFLQLSEPSANLVRETVHSLKEVVLRFGKSYLLIMAITFAEILIGLLIIGQSAAVLIALAIAVFDIFPVVGAGMILLPWAVITLMAGSLGKGLGLLALWIVVIVVRQIIEPRIVGRSVGLHPLITLMSMFVGTKLFGGIGLFGLPITCAILKSLNDGGVIHLFRRETASGPSEESAAE